MSSVDRSGLAPLGWRDALRAVGGYVWWYFDALSAEGDGLVAIFFVGSVFSPDYAARLRRGERALPTEHAAVNLALYKRGRRDGAARQVAWVMSEYGAAHEVDERRIAIGGSSVEETTDGWLLRIDERTAPWRHRVAGTVRVVRASRPLGAAALSTAGATHAWQVLSPRCRVEARFEQPGFALDGVGYHDRNHGDGRLEDAFSRWGWARVHEPDATTVLYSMVERDGRRRALWVRARDDESPAPVEGTPTAEVPPRALPYGLALPWGFGVEVAPAAAAASAGAVALAGAAPGDVLACTPTALLEKAPFYARYATRLDAGRANGQAVDAAAVGVGEHLDLDAFRSRWNQFLLRFKTRRA